MCDKAIDIFSFIINSVSDRSINQSFVIHVFLKILLSENIASINIKMCGKAVDSDLLG